MRRRQFHAWCASSLAATSLAANGAAQLLAAEPAKKEFKQDDWGDLTSTFLYDGEPPPPKRLKIDKDQSAAKEPLYDRTLTVDPQTKAIQYVCAWLVNVPGSKALPLHPDDETTATDTVQMEIKNFQFEPFIQAVRVGQRFALSSPDPIGHNATYESRNRPFHAVIPVNNRFVDDLVRQAENLPSPVACTIHPWENGWVIFKNHPYVGISDAAGKLVIKNLPVGNHTFVFWHPLSGWVTDHHQAGRKATWLCGQMTVNIKPGGLNLGEVTFKPNKPAEGK